MAWFGRVVRGVPALLLATAMLAGEPVAAQNEAPQTAHVVGRVTDGAGNAVEGATLELVAEADGSRVTTASSETGGFEFRRVAAGVYTLRTVRAGFAARDTRVTVQAGGRHTVIARLWAGRSIPTSAFRQ